MELKIEEFKINGIKFKIKELDTDSALKLTKYKDEEEAARKILEFSVIEPELTKEYLSKLPAKIGLKLILKINKLNGFEAKDFTTVPEVLPKQTNGK